MRFAFCVILLLLIQGCAERMQKTTTENNQNQAEVKQPSVETQPPALKGFQPVKVMLSNNCAPCHDPGGKMYERLPFDNPEVVRAHSTPILGRLNKAEDKRILEDWLSEPQL